MSRKYGVTANAIKKRVNRLIQSGVIEDFILVLSPAMTNASPFIALAYSNTSLDNESFINEVGNHRLVRRVGFDSYGACVIIGNYRYPEDLSEFNEFIRGFDIVRDCEIHPLPTNRGGKTELSTLQLRVVKALRDDPRKAIAGIAEESGLTARRVRSILARLIDDEIIRLTIRMAPNAGDSIWVTFRIRWDPKDTSASQIRDTFQQEFPNSFHRANHSATESVMWADFLIDQIRESESIAHIIKVIPSARVENTILPFPGRYFPGLVESTLDEMLTKAGLLETP